MRGAKGKETNKSRMPSAGETARGAESGLEICRIE